ncbi:DUF397 domain-containing protein [Actinomadura rugatobispora]|uniref:DUF397 domain-containing protein n=1 Tax=Actinomadura rugatobispora TaxID=1994 RepID=A0ABW1A4D9_9ACTN|nr:DUF397 domain-containing protein [Actinomadura rugatobispora]
MSLPVDASRIRWRKASRSSGTGSDCVEIADVANTIAVRDSRDPAGPKILVTRAGWRELARRVADGELDVR